MWHEWVAYADMVVAVVGLAAVSVLTRSFFFLSDHDWQLSPVLERAMRYAPLAALAAVVAPDVVLVEGAWDADWRNAHWWAALAAVAYAAWRRDMLGTLAVGMGVLLALKLGWGW